MRAIVHIEMLYAEYDVAIPSPNVLSPGALLESGLVTTTHQPSLTLACDDDAVMCVVADRATEALQRRAVDGAHRRVRRAHCAYLKNYALLALH
jgi:hypothetical protein